MKNFVTIHLVTMSSSFDNHADRRRQDTRQLTTAIVPIPVQRPRLIADGNNAYITISIGYKSATVRRINCNSTYACDANRRNEKMSIPFFCQTLERASHQCRRITNRSRIAIIVIYA